MFSFPSRARLLKRRDFDLICKRGRRLSTPFFWVDYRLAPASRLGVSASAKFGSSVERNRFKRQAREIFRLHAPFFSSPIEIHLIPKREAKGVSSEVLTEWFLKVIPFVESKV